MKKTILFLCASILSIGSFAQTTYMASAASAASSANYTYQVPKGPICGLTIQIITSPNFNGTTSSDTLQVSSDGVNWTNAIKSSDGTSKMYHSISAPSSELRPYTYELFSGALFAYYRVKYVKGNASVGNITIIAH